MCLLLSFVKQVFPLINTFYCYCLFVSNNGRESKYAGSVFVLIEKGMDPENSNFRNVNYQLFAVYSFVTNEELKGWRRFYIKREFQKKQIEFAAQILSKKGLSLNHIFSLLLLLFCFKQ